LKYNLFNNYNEVIDYNYNETDTHSVKCESCYVVMVNVNTIL